MTQLKKNRRSRQTPVRLLERSNIVLLAAAGMPNYQIAVTLKIDVNKVGRWRNRFAQRRLAGIEKDLPRGANHGGKNSAAQAKLRSTIMAMTTQDKPPDATQWSTRGLAKVLGINHSLVNRVWREVGLKPHLTMPFKVSTDPHFEEKLQDVVGLYVAPPANAVVFCIDEKSSIQALDRTQPGLPMKPGRCGTMTHDSKRHGTTTLVAALNVAEGTVISTCLPRHRPTEWLKFLRLIDAQTPSDNALHLIVDNSATHKHPTVQHWLMRHPRFHMHFTPTSSSWLNLVERFFGELTTQRLRRRVPELIQAIDEYITQRNVAPKPFAWRATVGSSINKITRARKALNKTRTA